MRPRGRLAAGMVLLSLWGAVTAGGSGLRDLRGGWLFTPRDLDLILRDPGPGSGVGAGSAGTGFWVAAGQGSLFSMPELPLARIEGGVAREDGQLAWSLAGAWERLGRDLFVEDIASLHLGVGSNPRITIQLDNHQWRVASEKSGDDLGFAFGGLFSFGVHGGITGVLGLFLTPGGPPNRHGSRGRCPLLDLKLLVSGGGLALRLDQRGDGAPLIRAEAMGRLSSGFGVGFLADPETGSLGCNLAFRVGPMWLRTSHLTHPALGTTHRFYLGMGDPRAAFP